MHDKGISAWDCLPQEYKTVSKIKKIEWKPNKDDEGLKNLMNDFC